MQHVMRVAVAVTITMMMISLRSLSTALRCTPTTTTLMRCRASVSTARRSLCVTHKDKDNDCHSHSLSLFASVSPRTVSAVYEAARALFERECVPESDESARHLLSHAAGLGSRLSQFQRRLDDPLSPAQIEAFAALCAQRVQRVPVQYLLREWDFFGLTLRCRPPVLIPRPETEELVQHILDSDYLRTLLRECTRTQSEREVRVLDVGAGTGAIGLSLAHSLRSVRVTAIDISDVAAPLANKNAELVLGKEEAQRRYRCELTSFEDFLATRKRETETETETDDGFDIVVSNPPYIPSGDIPSLQREVVDFEDRRALDGGADGLDMVWQLVRGVPALLRRTETTDGDKSRKGELWLEVSHEHPQMIKEQLSSKSDEWEFVEFFKDLSDHPRFVRLRLK